MTPSTVPCIQDRATIITILTMIAGLIATIHPGFDLSPFIPAIAAAIVGIAPLVLIFSKHHYAQGIEAAVATAPTIVTAAGSSLSPQLDERITNIETQLVKIMSAFQQ